jgi:hypothetical protein
VAGMNSERAINLNRPLLTLWRIIGLGNLFCLLCSGAAGQSATIDGTATAKGNAYVGAFKVVAIRRDNRDDRKTGDVIPGTGTYYIRGLDDGHYDVLVCGCVGYWPQMKIDIEIKGGGVNRTVKFTLVPTSAHTMSADAHLHGRFRHSDRSRHAPVTIKVYASECKDTEIKEAVIGTQGQFDIKGLIEPLEYHLVVDVDGSVKAAQNPVVVYGPNPPLLQLTAEDGTLNVEVGNGNFSSIPGDHHIRKLVDKLPLGSLVSGLVTPSSPPAAANQPGTPSVEEPSKSGNAVNGQTVVGRDYTVDGTQVADTLVKQPEAATVGSNVVSEVEFVQTGEEIARGGNFSPSQINVRTLARTNSFHGRLEYRVENDARDARNFFDLPGFDTLRRDMGSAQVGGPIRKDRNSFFVSNDLARGAAAPTFSPLLTSRISALNEEPPHLRFPTEDLRGLLATSARDSPGTRLDYTRNINHSIFARYGFQRDLSHGELPAGPGGTSAAPSAARDVSSISHSFTLDHKWTALLRITRK